MWCLDVWLDSMTFAESQSLLRLDYLLGDSPVEGIERGIVQSVRRPEYPATDHAFDPVRIRMRGWKRALPFCDLSVRCPAQCPARLGGL